MWNQMSLYKIFDNSIHPYRQHQFLRSELNFRCFILFMQRLPMTCYRTIGSCDGCIYTPMSHKSSHNRGVSIE